MREEASRSLVKRVVTGDEGSRWWIGLLRTALRTKAVQRTPLVMVLSTSSIVTPPCYHHNVSSQLATSDHRPV